MVFYSKRDRWIVIVGVITIIVLIGAAITGFFATDESLLLRVSIGILLIIASVYFIIILVNTRYIIRKNYLHIGNGLFNKKIGVHSITHIRATNDIISSPALSTDRIEIFFGENKSILISPKEKKEFLDALIVINPNIQLDIDLLRTLS
jgi:cbb3-type cytochrome oxidase subunit 1